MKRKKKKKPSVPSPKPQSQLFDMQDELNHGKALQQSGRLAEAQTVYQKILARHPHHLEILHLSGVIAIQTGQNETAVKLIKAALLEAPGNPVLCSNLGNALNALGRRPEAIDAYKMAIQSKPDFASAHYNMATVLQALGNTSDAIQSYRNALKFQPDFVDAHSNLGIVLQSRGEFSKAVDQYRAALAVNPSHIQTLNNLGVALQKQGNPDQAVACLEKAVNIAPNFVDAYYNMGNARYAMGDFDGAVAAFQKVVEIQPGHVNAIYNMGTVYQEKNQPDKAVDCFNRTMALQPDHFKAHNSMGNIMMDLGHLSQALSWFEQAISVNPDSSDAYNNKGNALEKMGELDHALAAFQEAVRLDPENAIAHVNRGILLKGRGEADAAVVDFEKALDIDPEMDEALSQLTHQCQHICDWERLAVLGPRLDMLTAKALKQGQRTAESPFSSLSRHPDPALNQAVARSWSDYIVRMTANLKIKFDHHGALENTVPGSRKLTIGYLSNNFRDHPMAHIMLGLFRLHDRDRFNVFCYSSGRDDGSVYRKQIAADCDRFVDLKGMSTLDAAQCIYNDRVDILVDLMGHTKNDRLDICSLRPAPVQARYLGMAGTTGADFFDYIICDPIIVPEADLPFYNETPVWLPHCYQVNDHHQKIADKKWDRSEFGLPEDAFVFCAFNTSYKIEPVIFDVWMRILAQLPGSVLWLLGKNQTIADNLKKAAEKRGVLPQRLHFSGKLPKDQHLARIRLADLALDTRIVGGAASTSDVLWAGVPVITMTGTHFASRMSTSILNAMGLPELIATDTDGYEALALALAQNPGRLAQFKTRIGENRQTAPLFDTPRFVQNLERAYEQMWQGYVQKAPARPITVTDPMALGYS